MGPLVKFDFQYQVTLPSDRSNLELKYTPDELLDFFATTSFNSISLNMVKGRWREVLQKNLAQSSDFIADATNYG